MGLFFFFFFSFLKMPDGAAAKCQALRKDLY